MFNIGCEAFAASRACKDVRGSQIHETTLAEGVATLKNPGNLIFVVVLIVTNRAGHVHFAVQNNLFI